MPTEKIISFPSARRDNWTTEVEEDWMSIDAWMSKLNTSFGTMYHTCYRGSYLVNSFYLSSLILYKFIEQWRNLECKKNGIDNVEYKSKTMESLNM